jgi:hypothetical protein
MSSMNETPAEWALPRGQARRLPAAPRGRWLAATHGRAWLTRSGSGPAREADVFVAAGQRHWLPAGSEWVVEGWGDAGFLLLEATC